MIYQLAMAEVERPNSLKNWDFPNFLWQTTECWWRLNIGEFSSEL